MTKLNTSAIWSGIASKIQRKNKLSSSGFFYCGIQSYYRKEIGKCVEECDRIWYTKETKYEYSGNLRFSVATWKHMEYNRYVNCLILHIFTAVCCIAENRMVIHAIPMKE